MAKKVLKFGGKSVGSIDRIVHAAKIVKKEHDSGNKVIVVISAMAGTTNNLTAYSKSISKKFNKRELDVLLTSGEQVTSALMAGALNELGVKSKSWMNWQIPILTEGEHTNSRIINMNIKGINNYLSEGGVAVIPGFQGISKSGDITSIGRGGSDATAVAIAKIFDTDSCEIYTDVEGVYSSDPNKIPLAKKINKISYEEMLELSSLGAKVMQSSAVQTAMMYDIPLQVKSTFTDRKGTEIFNQDNIDYTKVVTGVAYSKDDAKIILIGVEDKPGVAADIFEPLSKSEINVDMIIQNVSSDGKKTDLTFTIKRQDKNEAASLLKLLKDNKKIKYEAMQMNDKVSKISIVGAGMVATPGISYKMFKSLAQEKINILAISTSEIKVSVIIDEQSTIQAVKRLHKTFNLD
jgi:aspartate kinase